MVIVTYESYDSVLVGTGKQKASDSTDAMCRGRSFQMMASETGNAHLLTVEEFSANPAGRPAITAAVRDK